MAKISAWNFNIKQERMGKKWTKGNTLMGFSSKAASEN